MQVVLIGSGNIATVIGKILIQKGHSVLQVYSRNLAHAQLLAGEIGADAIDQMDLLNKGADYYVIAVTDDAMADIVARIRLKDQLVIHTAGAASKDILKNCSSRFGVLWPMKMVRKDMMTLDPVSIFIDGNEPETIDVIRQLALELSETVSVADDATREKLHLLATVTSNFTNHLYHLAADYCAREGIDFQLLYPIILETVQQIKAKHPAAVQAGPAFRNDTKTILKHQRLLENDAQLLKLYTDITESIRLSFSGSA